jgi:phage repressor protein C with HTH and peptisase S24 domain
MNTYETDKVDKSVERSDDEHSTDFDVTFNRLKEATGARTDTELARLIGLKQSSISTAKAKRTLPSGWMVEVSKRFNVSTDWLFFGIGSMQRSNAHPAPAPPDKICPIPLSEPQWMDPEAAPALGYTLVPKVKARLAAGTGSLETEGEVIGYYAFKTDFLRRKGRAKKMVLMDVVGDSMEPVLMEADSVLIDESQNEIISGGLFAIGIEQEVFIKYLDRIPGKLVLRSRNERYMPIEVDMNGQISDSVRIIGRVVWSCREYVR